MDPTEAPNPFLEHGERTMPSPVKAKQRAADKRRLQQEDPEYAKRLEESSEQLKRYRARRKEERDKLLAGSYGAPAKVLVEFLVSTFNLDRQGRLIETVKAGPWQDADERHPLHRPQLGR
jgi:hypothetical protein